MAAGLFGSYRVLLAPMAGVSDAAFRTLCIEQGADLTYTEMVSAKGLSYANEKTRHLLELAEGERRVGVQLFGHEPATMASQAAWVEDVLGDKLACIDVNMGCPARKIVTKGDGSALMKDPVLAETIVSAIRESVSCKVTAKFRRGWGEGDETAPEFAKRLEQAGVDAVTVHGRFATQMYKGRSDRGAIARVKGAVTVPVVGNGDVRTAQDALDLVADTGCDAVMVARGAQGNPWIFSQVKSAFDGGEPPEAPSARDRIEMARRHARLLNARDPRSVVRMRKHAMWYVAGLPDASRARGLINDCSTLDEFERLFDRIVQHVEALAERDEL